MNIQQFYQKTAAISLNASLVSLVPPFFLILFGIIVVPNKYFVIFIIPFLVYSFCCYQSYLVNARRSKKVLESLTNTRISTKLLDAQEVMIAFLPAPSLRFVIFDKDGRQIGEVRDLTYWTLRWILPYILDKLLEKKYGLYDESNQLLATFLLKKDGIEIFPLTGESFVIKKLRRSRKELIYTAGKQTLTIKQSVLFTDYQFYKEEILISRLRKGWLPLEAGRKFIDPNTPVLTVENYVDKEEKLIVFAVLTERLRYTDH